MEVGKRRERESGRRPTWSKSNGIFFFVCDELMIEILKRVAIKDVHRCKSVSKRWCKVISTNHFVACYIQHHKQQQQQNNVVFGMFYQETSSCDFKYHNAVRMIYATDDDNNSIFKSSAGFYLLCTAKKKIRSSSIRIFRNPTVYVLLSTNGLLLCSDTLHCYHTRYYVCNPLTNQWVSTPPPPSAGLKWAHVGFVCKATERDIVNNSCSFVIVRIPNFGDKLEPSILKVEIYDSENGQWAESDELDSDWRHNFGIQMFFFSQSLFWLTAVVWKGLLHWRSFWKVFVYDPSSSSYSTNKCTTIQLPHDEVPKMTTHSLLGECKGQLVYTYFHHCMFTMWQLKYHDVNGTGEWSLLHKIDLLDHMVFDQPFVMSFLRDEQRDFRFLAFHPFHEAVVFIYIKGHVVSFNMHENIITDNAFLKRWAIRSGTFYCVVLPWWPVPLDLSTLVSW